jgi:hypothetical protein
MTFVVAWVLFPLVLAALSVGCALLLEAISESRLRPALVLPAGFALVVVVAQFAPLSDATAELAAPAVVGCAVAGLLLGRAHLRRGDGWALAAAVAAFAFYAAPVAFSGSATFAGYIKLDDTATYFAMLDRLLEHGRSLDGLPPSTYEATLATTLAYGYPVGSLLPLGVGAALTGEDPAWLFQPYIAFLAALLALCLYELSSSVIRSRPARAGVAVVAGQAALLYGYSLWGGLKEVGAAALVALVAALLPTFSFPGTRSRELVPLAAAAAALVGFLSLAGAVWIAPAFVVAVVMLARRRRLAVSLRRAGRFSLLALLLAVPELVAAATWLPRAASFTEGQLGNLAGPLDPLQVAGIWPAGDFRFGPTERAPTYVLIGVAAAGAALGLVWAWRRRAVELLAYVLALTIGCVLFVAIGSPWVEAKALAMTSPAVILSALIGVGALFQAGRRAEGAVVAAAVVAGVLWSNALAYHAVWLAPRDQLAELERIGRLTAGRGPTLMTDFQPYGARHFLRDAAPEGASELRRRRVPLRQGSVLGKGAAADVDAFATDAVLTYPTLVLRRSPAASRPPAAYRRTWQGRFYEIWERHPASRLLEHLALGAGAQPVALPDCGRVVSLARLAGPEGHLVASSRPAPVFADVVAHRPSGAWKAEVRAGPLYPRGSGTVEATVGLPVGGRYAVWIGGSYRGRVRVQVGGRDVGEASAHLEHSGGQYTFLGARRLGRGRHTVILRYDAPRIRPGAGGRPFALGPIALTQAAPARLRSVAIADARSLCGRALDWIEAVRP